MIPIDGSYMEGGGQILRTALALSTLTGRSFRAERIRRNRPSPGLKAQHLSAIKALIRMSGARVKGAAAGASEIEFVPGTVTPRHYSLDIGTAGSVTLLMQALLLPCMFAGRRIKTVRITDHLRANVYVCERFLGTKFTIDEAAAMVEAE